MGDFLVRVFYEDTDCGGIVYHSNYLNFCERARSELFFARGINPLGEVGFVVRSIACEFLKTAKLGDLLRIKTKIKEQKSAQITLLQEIFIESNIECEKCENNFYENSSQNLTLKPIFSAEIKLVCVDTKSAKVRKIPDFANEIFKKLDLIEN